MILQGGGPCGSDPEQVRSRDAICARALSKSKSLSLTSMRNKGTGRLSLVSRIADAACTAPSRDTGVGPLCGSCHRHPPAHPRARVDCDCCRSRQSANFATGFKAGGSAHIPRFLPGGMSRVSSWRSDGPRVSVTLPPPPKIPARAWALAVCGGMEGG
jgi:hypothetical protein